jgi:hypothetical protein
MLRPNKDDFPSGSTPQICHVNVDVPPVFLMINDATPISFTLPLKGPGVSSSLKDQMFRSIRSRLVRCIGHLGGR